MADDDEREDEEETEDEEESEDEEETEDEEELDGDDEDGEGAGSKKKLFIIIGVVVVLVISGLSGAYFAGLFDSLLGSEKKTESMSGESEGGEGGVLIFKEFPDILTNLNTGRRKKVGVRIKIVLELASEEDLLRIGPILPKVHDSIQVFIRDQKVNDLKGAAGMQRIREALLARLNKAFAPSKIRDLYFKEMLVR